MKTKDKFEETKIKMVMKLKKLSRKEAEADVARSDAQHTAGRAGPSKMEPLISAKEFFGEL